MPSAEWQRLIAGQVLRCTFADSDILPCNLGSGSLVTAWTGTGGRADAGSKGQAVKRSCRFGLLGLLHLAPCREETQAAGGEGPRATPSPAPSPGRFWVARSPAGGDWSSRFSLNPIYEARLDNSIRR